MLDIIASMASFSLLLYSLWVCKDGSKSRERLSSSVRIEGIVSNMEERTLEESEETSAESF